MSPTYSSIIAVGSEVLDGYVINSNAAWLASQIRQLGLINRQHCAVADDPSWIQDAVSQAFQHSSLLVMTGGLGPTPDDLTVESLASWLNVELEEDSDARTTLEQRFVERQRVMTPENLKQAYRPVGAVCLQNPIGTAPGLFWDLSKQFGKPAALVALPGVPTELKALWPQVVEQLAVSGLLPVEQSRRFERTLQFYGLGESDLVAKLPKKLFASTVSPYVKRDATIQLRLKVEALTEEEAHQSLETLQHTILENLKPYWIGTDETDLVHQVGQALIQEKHIVAVAESCTGGLVSHLLTNVPGSSAYIRQNWVTYSNQAKMEQLNVSENLLIQYGAVSEAAVTAMAEGALQQGRADYGLALSGIAGPGGGSEEKPVGLLYVGLAQVGRPTVVKVLRQNPHLSREALKERFARFALFILWQRFQGVI